jgi:polyhydroxyalkanoate synthesis repressor PhaR
MLQCSIKILIALSGVLSRVKCQIMAKKTVVIRKYENRRLYDSANSRYVNLEEVGQLLQQGNDVQVIDAATSEDITRLILTQIVVEDAKAADSSFPLDLLRQMVIASGRASQESALNYMKAMFDIYQNTYRAMAPPFNPFEFMQNLGTKRGMPDDGKQERGSTSSSGTQPKTPEPPDTDEVKDLKRRIAELENLVSGLVPGKS